MHNIIWTSILTPIGIGLLFTLLRRFFPVRAAPPLTEPLTDEERRLYRRWEIGSALLWLPIVLVLSSWGTAEGCFVPDPRVDDPIVRYVSLRSRKPILPRQ